MARKVRGIGTIVSMVGIALGLLAAGRIRGALAEHPGPRRPPSTRESGLKSEYRIRLVSAWPRTGTGTDRCSDPGQDVVQGVLTRVGDSSYVGRFQRTTRLVFCGAHSRAQEQPCRLELKAGGPVRVQAAIRQTQTSAAMHLAWSPIRADTKVMVSGSCTPEFQASLQRMYLGTSRHLEFPLQSRDGNGRGLALEDYGWTVQVD